MIAFCLERLGRDPAWLIGADVPQLGGNAGTGEGWLVVEGDESDRTIAALRPRVAVLTNVDLDHHATFGSRAEVAELFDGLARERPGGRARRRARPVRRASSRSPVSTTGATRRPRSRRSSLQE